MIKVNLFPKYSKKYTNKNQLRTHKEIPSNWFDFASLCNVRSGLGIVKFIPYEYQVKVIESVINYPTTVIGKCRQQGISETLANYALFRASQEAGFLSAFFSRSSVESSMIAKRVRRQIQGLEDDGYLTTSNDNLTDIQIERNGKSLGRMLFRNSSPNGVRGIPSLSLAIFDECAFVDNIEEIYKSSIPATSMLGDKARICLISTPNGQSGFFWDKLNRNNENDLLATCESMRSGSLDPYQQWQDDKGISKVLIHWRSHPIYSQQKNYLEDIKNRYELPDDVVNQEYDLSFLDGDSLVFNSSLVRDCAISQWSDPQEDDIIYMGLDTSLGGDDYTVLTVLRLSDDNTLSLVDWYRARKKTHQENIYQIRKLIDKWNPIKVGIEVNSGGLIYFEELTEQCLNIDFQAIKTSAVSKPIMVNRLILTMENKQLIFPDNKNVIEEFLSFRRNGSKLEAIEGKHDDIICSLMFGIMASPLGS